MIGHILLAAVVSFGFSQSSSEPPAPVGPVPHARQRAWQELELYAFVHFNMNTFTDHEWGEGREDPKQFNPTELDCRQWAKVFRDAGLRGVIITAKHHDGFCLWPSDYTEHDVASSDWQEGRGDVLRSLSEACREFGLKFGVYLSPWDRHHPDYGNSDVYNEYFKNQLREVLTGYGEVFEVWFDGACGEGPNGKRQQYDWPAFVGVVRECQSNAVIFSDGGPDVRWVGNERGFAGETCWSFLRRGEVYPGYPHARELTVGHANGTHWVPAECDVSIRPGWYYHASQDEKVKSAEHLLRIYHGSVGRNANLLLNFPVDRRGLVHERDVASVMEFRAALDRIYANDIARGASATASNVRGASVRFSPANLTDGSNETYWATNDSVQSASALIDFRAPQVFDRVVLREPIALGQRTKSFSIDAGTGDSWVEIARGTTIGNKRIVLTGTVRASRIRVTIHESRACPILSSVEVYAAPPSVAIHTPAAHFFGETTVTLRSDDPKAEIRYTTNGASPSRESTRYQRPIRVDRTCEVRAIAVRGEVTSLAEARLSFRRYSPAELQVGARPKVALVPGVSFALYERAWQSLADLEGKPTRSGEIDGIRIDVTERKEQYAIVFEAYLEVPTNDVYTLYLTSDDGSRLYLHDKLLIDNDGLHGMVERSAVVALATGAHPIRIEYFQATGDAELQLEMSSSTMRRQKIPAGHLYRR